jgi:methyltransferase (TIGR00027 family)
MALEGRRNVFARSTAEGAASLRAMGAREPDQAVRNPDYLAERFIAPGPYLTSLAKLPVLWRANRELTERLFPGLYWYEIARVKHMDAVLMDEIERGIEQLVVLGAGFDSRAYRFERELSGVRVFEVDHPVTAAMKRARLEDMYGARPAHVTYVEVDFEVEDWARRLLDAGYDHGQPSLFIWCGVSMYIPQEAVAGVLAFVGSSSSPGTSIVFDHISREMAEGREALVANGRGPAMVRRLVAQMGEPYRFGVSQPNTPAFVECFGLRLESDLDTQDLAQRYLTDSRGRMRGDPREGGVAIAHARVRRD